MKERQLQISKLLYRLGDNKLIGSFPVSGSPQILKLLDFLENMLGVPRLALENLSGARVYRVDLAEKICPT